MTLTIPLPWTQPPLTANQRLHWAAKARLTREVRQTAMVLARHHKAPRADRVIITLHWRPKVGRKRDTINLAPLHKALVDGLIDAGVAEDDTHEHVSTPEAVILPPGEPALWLELDYPNGDTA